MHPPLRLRLLRLKDLANLRACSRLRQSRQALHSSAQHRPRHPLRSHNRPASSPVCFKTLRSRRVSRRNVLHRPRLRHSHRASLRGCSKRRHTNARRLRLQYQLPPRLRLQHHPRPQEPMNFHVFFRRNCRSRGQAGSCSIVRIRFLNLRLNTTPELSPGFSVRRLHRPAVLHREFLRLLRLQRLHHSKARANTLACSANPQRRLRTRLPLHLRRRRRILRHRCSRVPVSTRGYFQRLSGQQSRPARRLRRFHPFRVSLLLPQLQ